MVALFVLARVFELDKQLLELLQKVKELGAVAHVVFIGIYVLATVLFVPGLIITMAAGALFGLGLGTVDVSIASITGASCAFLIGRYFARGWVSKRIEGSEKFSAIDEAVGREGWKIVLLTRLSPVFPFNLLNYAYGLTRVSFWAYFLSSWIGMLPGTIMYVYLGKAAGDLATLGAEREKHAGETVLFWVGLAVTIVVTVFVTRVARKALTKKVDTDIEESGETHGPVTEPS